MRTADLPLHAPCLAPHPRKRTFRYMPPALHRIPGNGAGRPKNFG